MTDTKITKITKTDNPYQTNMFVIGIILIIFGFILGAALSAEFGITLGIAGFFLFLGSLMIGGLNYHRS